MLKTPFTIVTAIFVSTTAFAAGNHASFSHNGDLNASALGAIISSSHVDFHPVDATPYGGNIVGSNISNSMGIVAINQNTGINSNVQQAVTVRIGNMNLNSQNASQ